MVLLCGVWFFKFNLGLRELKGKKGFVICCEIWENEVMNWIFFVVVYYLNVVGYFVDFVEYSLLIWFIKVCILLRDF